MLKILIFAAVLAIVVVQGFARTSTPTIQVHNSRGKSLRHSTIIQTVDFKDSDFVAKEAAASTSSSSLDKFRGPACIIGGALAHLTLGTLYCWGNFLSYSLPSLRFLDGKAHPGETPDALYVLPLTMVAQAIAMPFGPSISSRIGYSGTLLLGSWLTAAAVFIASYQTRLLPFIAFYSLMFGTGVGLAYTAPMSAGWKWLPNAKGLVSGGILTGFGAGGFIFSMIGSKLVNPTKANPINGKFPDSVYAAFPHMLRVLSVLYALFSLVGSLLVTDKPNAVAATSPANGNKNAPKSIAAPAAPASWGLTVGESVKTYQFWLMWTMIISSATAGLNTASIYKTFASTSSALVGDEYQAMVGGIGALFNGFGRLFWGAISDIIGFKNSFTLLTILQMTLMLTYKFSADSKLAFAVNTCGLFFCLAGNLALMPPATQRMFGPKAGAVIYGVIYSAFAIASVVGGILTKSLAVTVGYSRLFQVMAVMSIIATGLVQFLRPLASESASVV